MNKEQIKSELIARVRALPNEQFDPSSPGKLMDKILRIQPFAQRITGILVQILLEANLSPTDQQWDDLLSYLHPTYVDLVQEKVID
jgi:hypothetical protein